MDFKLKTCNNRQLCFELGKSWGHAEFVLCEHLCEEKDDNEKPIDYCEKYKCQVFYDSKNEKPNLMDYL